jgi:1,4-dihydroxy-2-naphthoate octaprenyltransferase
MTDAEKHNRAVSDVLRTLLVTSFASFVGFLLSMWYNVSNLEKFFICLFSASLILMVVVAVLFTLKRDLNQ